MMLGMAGLLGYPFMDDLAEVVGRLWRRFGPTGKTIKQEIREMIQAMHGDPQLWMRGLGHNVGGVNISQSVGQGRLVPGMDVVRMHADSPAEAVGTFVLDLTGVAGNTIKWGLEMAGGANPWQETLRKAPGGLGSIWTAYRWSEEGVRGPSGGLILKGPDGEPREPTSQEIFLRALGFADAEVSLAQEIMWEQHDAALYWTARQRGLLTARWEAWQQNDREALADADRAIEEYNGDLPEDLKRLRITGATLRRSRKARAAHAKRETQGRPFEKRYRELYEGIEEGFEEEEETP